MNKKKTYFVISIIILILLIIGIFLILKKQSDVIRYTGENENWFCELQYDTSPNPKTGEYTESHTAKSKKENLKARRIDVRWVSGETEIASMCNNALDRVADMSGVSLSGGTMYDYYFSPDYGESIMVYISVDGEEEIIELKKQL